MTTDFHAHYVSPALAQFLRQREAVPHLRAAPGGGEWLTIPGATRLAFDASYTDIAARLDFMDRLGIRRQLLSLPGLFGVDRLALPACGEALRAWNDDVAAICRAHPDRFLGLAALPLADMASCVRELQRAHHVLGLVGAILPINAFLTRADAERMRPLFEVADALALHLFIHPGPRPDETHDASEAAPDQPIARRALQVQSQVGQAMVTLLLTDFLDRYPHLTVQVANLGGILPAVLERLDHTVRARNLPQPLPSQQMRRVVVDCASLGPRMLELAVAAFGAQQVVFGSDCPIFRTDWTLDAVHQARLTAGEREAILAGNARRLLARFATPVPA